MKWTSLATVAALAAATTGFALVLDRETPAKAAATDLQSIASVTGQSVADAAVLRPKFDVDLVKDAHAFLPTPPPQQRTVKVARGDTLMKLLTDSGVDRRVAHTAILELSDVYDVRRLQIGQDIVLTFQEQAAGPAFLGLALRPSPDRDVAVRAISGQGFVAEEIERVLERRDDYATAKVRSSLYEAALDADMPIDVLLDLVRVFSFDVDFQRDIQPGDSVEVLFDRYEDELGNRVRNGDIRFAAMTLSGKRMAFYRHTPSSGITDYFDEKGQSVRKTLMRTPINGARLSSGYGNRRHPILGYNKMHKGVDFAAPTGTPIMAAGDGVIEKAGRNGAYGHYIRVRHNSSIKTAYAHLSKYARGTKVGNRVKQGDIIGYVGSTGRSTGPHLHYEVLVDGRQKNPMSVKLPAGEKLKGKDLEALKRRIPEIDRRLAMARERPSVASR